MATKLFLRNTTTNGITESGWTYYDMVTTAGASLDTAVTNTTAGGTEIPLTKTAGGASNLAWVSGRVPAGGFTLTTTDISAWFAESNMNANAGGRYRVFRRATNGTETELGGGPFNDGVEFGTATTEMTWLGNVTDTAFAENERIVVKLYLTNAGTMGGSFNCTLSFNAADAATGDSFFNIAETVSFKLEDITGSFAATETGADTFAATGEPIATGSLAATETGSDTLAADADAIATGSLTVTETGSDTLAAAGTVSEGGVTGSLAATESGSDTLAVDGDVALAGALNATEVGSDTLAADGDVKITASLTVSETGADSASINADALATATVALSETGTDTFNASAQAIATAAVALTETGTEVLSVSGDLTVAGSASLTETGSDTTALTGEVNLAGSLTCAETGTDTLAADADVICSAQVSLTETGIDVLAGTGQVPVAGALATTETGLDQFYASSGAFPDLTGSFAAQETGADTLAVLAGLAVTGAAAAQETSNDVAGASGQLEVVGTLIVQEAGQDTLSGQGKALISGQVSGVETGNDTASLSGHVGDAQPVTGSLNAVESGQDRFSYLLKLHAKQTLRRRERLALQSGAPLQTLRTTDTNKGLRRA